MRRPEPLLGSWLDCCVLWDSGVVPPYHCAWTHVLMSAIGAQFAMVSWPNTEEVVSSFTVQKKDIMHANLMRNILMCHLTLDIW